MDTEGRRQDVVIRSGEEREREADIGRSEHVNTGGFARRQPDGKEKQGLNGGDRVRTVQARGGAGENARLAGAVKDRNGLGEGGWCLFLIFDVEWRADGRVDHDATSIVVVTVEGGPGERRGRRGRRIVRGVEGGREPREVPRLGQQCWSARIVATYSSCQCQCVPIVRHHIGLSSVSCHTLATRGSLTIYCRSHLPASHIQFTFNQVLVSNLLSWCPRSGCGMR